MSTRIVTWNVRHGGRRRYPAIRRVLESIDADVVLLTEYRLVPDGADLADQLVAAGWTHLHRTITTPGLNSTLIASRLPINKGPVVGHESCPHRWVHAAVPAAEIDLFGIYFHGVTPSREKAAGRAEREEMTDTLVGRLAGMNSSPALAIGDFNTGGVLDSTNGYFRNGRLDRFLDTGWADGYGHLHGDRREYSWWNSSGNGFLIDHALVTGPLQERLRRIELVHTADGIDLHDWPGRDRDDPAASDHAALLVEIELPSPR